MFYFNYFFRWLNISYVYLVFIFSTLVGLGALFID